MLLLLCFFYVCLRFFEIQKVVTFYVFCRVSYDFSNYRLSVVRMCYCLRTQVRAYVALRYLLTKNMSDFSFSQYKTFGNSNDCVLKTLLTSYFMPVQCSSQPIGTQRWSQAFGDVTSSWA